MQHTDLECQADLILINGEKPADYNLLSKRICRTPWQEAPVPMGGQPGYRKRFKRANN